MAAPAALVEAVMGAQMAVAQMVKVVVATVPQMPGQ